ncbi:hypothetical protein [Cellulomonas telluris]|uniref:hypothetical protein n=1 Tax=Cellulomonas telluris TaxID=2306636 RepID=UPI0010A895BC|nr:hypothetical protein [Cellulomonas telluris]
MPATPDWDAHDLLAHLAGAAHDAVHGRMDGAPGPAWSARHVGERRGRTAADLADELERCAAALPPQPPDRPTPEWDLLVHEADLREAWGLDRQPVDAWRPLLVRAAAFLAAGADGAGLTVATPTSVWDLGGGRRVDVSCDDHDLLRLLFGRRDAEHVTGSADAAAALAGLAFFATPR